MEPNAPRPLLSVPTQRTGLRHENRRIIAWNTHRESSYATGGDGGRRWLLDMTLFPSQSAPPIWYNGADMRATAAMVVARLTFGRHLIDPPVAAFLLAIPLKNS